MTALEKPRTVRPAMMHRELQHFLGAGSRAAGWRDPATDFGAVFRDGTLRLKPPEATLDALRPVLSRFGLTRVANVTGLDRIGIPVCLACRPNARSLAVAQGKGLTLAAAKASAIMESLELFHAEHVSLPVRMASIREVQASAEAPDPETLPVFRDSPLDASEELAWVKGVELFAGAPFLVPLDLVHTDFTVPARPGTGAFIASSTGLASGNHMVEALTHALCEAIERDAHTLWRLSSYDLQATTVIDPTTIRDRSTRDLLDRIDAAGLSVTLWDMTSDIALPVASCRISETDRGPSTAFGFATGTGCHPDRAIAIQRAITEAAQARLVQITGVREDLGNDFYGGTVPGRRALRVTPRHGPGRAFDAMPTFESTDLLETLLWILGRLRASGFAQAIAVDLSASGFPFAVVRAIVPGLEDGVDTPGYALGRRAINHIWSQ